MRCSRSRAGLAMLAGCMAAWVAGCGGGGGDGAPAIPIAPQAANVVSIVVDAGPPGLPYYQINVPFVTVTICVPGTSTCQSIDHVSVDTGSVGLRILHEVLDTSLASGLTQLRDANGAPVAECIRYADGSLNWGPVRAADLRIGGKSASALPIQVVGDPSFAAIPASCSGFAQQTVADQGAKGVLGVGPFLQDCGDVCATIVLNDTYFACASGGCASTTVPLDRQLLNPVSRFADDNNGVLIQLPAISPGGARSVTGSLVFGIGTQANNALGSAQVYGVDPDFGVFTTLYGSGTYFDSYLDSGSNAYFLPASVSNQVCPSTDPVAPGYICPTATLELALTIVGANGTTGAVGISVANAHNLFGDPTLTAYNNLGAPSPDPHGIDFGLPFFFGRSVFTAIEGASTPKGTGPYVAF